MAEQREIPGFSPDDVVNFFDNVLTGDRIPGNKLQDRVDEMVTEQGKAEELLGLIKKVEKAKEARNRLEIRLEIMKFSEPHFKQLLREGYPKEELTTPPKPEP